MNQRNTNCHEFTNCKSAGFTLVEIIFVVFFSTIIAGLMWSILSAGRDAWHTADTKIEIQDNLRLGMNRMVKELQGASSIDAISDNFLEFTASGNTVEYSIVNNRLIRTVAGSPKILANNINSVQFTLFGEDALEINLSGGKTTVLRRELNFNLTSRVVLRN